MEDYGLSINKNNEFLSSAEAFTHAVRVLMHGYAIASMADPPGREWCGLEAALRHVSVVGNMSRANSKSTAMMRGRIMEADAAVRMEWVKLGQLQPDISLSAIIDVVAQRHSIWPLMSEFARPTFTGMGGKHTWQDRRGGRSSGPREGEGKGGK